MNLKRFYETCYVWITFGLGRSQNSQNIKFLLFFYLRSKYTIFGFITNWNLLIGCFVLQQFFSLLVKQNFAKPQVRLRLTEDNSQSTITLNQNLRWLVHSSPSQFWVTIQSNRQYIHFWRLVSNNVDLQLSNTLSLFVDSADVFPSQSTSASYFKVSQAGIDVRRVKHIYIK